MQKQILSLAIALPTVLFTALPTLANPVQPITPKVDSLQPDLVRVFQAPAIQNQLSSPGNGESPGPTGGTTPVKGPGPRPPRRDTLLQLGTGLQNTIKSNSVNLNIANPVLDR
ncbi:hypothetical protein NSTC745_05045 [Nostoc sp. DSM 114161]|jgi:hypothetical protein|uniref:hypothetical protein n=1 Tax=Nostoc sp. DSM 114161 TaxID=3440143 RepID=UPI004045CBE7